VFDEAYPGIDVKGDGGMSIFPPSKTSKGVYRWTNKRRVAAAPEWLLPMVRKPESATREPNIWEQFASTSKPVSLAELTLAVAMLPNDDISWDPGETTRGWNAIGMAIYAASGGSAEGFALFDAWSQ